MADVDVRRVKLTRRPDTSSLPLLLAAVHLVTLRVSLFVAPFVTRVWSIGQGALRLLTLPYQVCCCMMLLTFLWPFLLLGFWFYCFVRLLAFCCDNGWAMPEMPEMVPLMGQVGRRPALAGAVAPAPARGQVPTVRRRHVTSASVPVPTPPAVSSPITSPSPAVAAPVLAAAPPTPGDDANVDASGAATAPSEAATTSLVVSAPAGGPDSDACRGDVYASGSASGDMSSVAVAPVCGSSVGTDGGDRPAGTGADTTPAAQAMSSAVAEAAGPPAKVRRSARDRSPDGWFGPPPPEEGGPEPPYVPLDPDFVDLTDLLPEEELAKYKFYKRRTPLRRVP